MQSLVQVAFCPAENLGNKGKEKRYQRQKKNLGVTWKQLENFSYYNESETLKQFVLQERFKNRTLNKDTKRELNKH